MKHKTYTFRITLIVLLFSIAAFIYLYIASDTDIYVNSTIFVVNVFTAYSIGRLADENPNFFRKNKDK